MYDLKSSLCINDTDGVMVFASWVNTGFLPDSLSRRRKAKKIVAKNTIVVNHVKTMNKTSQLKTHFSTRESVSNRVLKMWILLKLCYNSKRLTVLLLAHLIWYF